MWKEKSKSTITYSELCDIIRVCKENGISKFNSAGISLEFAPKEREVHTPPAEEIAAQKEKSILQDEQKIKKDISDNLLIEDPVLYEELLIKGELKDGRTSEAV